MLFATKRAQLDTGIHLLPADKSKRDRSKRLDEDGTSIQVCQRH